MRTISILAFALALAGCASPTPQVAVGKLSMNDPKFSSPECVDIRGKAVGYDDKVPERAMTGMALGLFLGPFGLPFAAQADASQEEQRHAFDREITLRCVTNGEAIVAADDAKRQADLSRVQAAREQVY